MSAPTQLDLMRGLLAADADDHELHVVYRDWLLERDDPRAELVHLQCPHGLESSTSHDGRERTVVADVRTLGNRLIRAHEAAWLGPFHLKAFSFRFRCGFLRELALTADNFVAGCRELFATTPCPELLTQLRSLELDRISDELCELLDNPGLRIERLGFRNPLIESAATALAHVPALARVRTLTMNGVTGIGALPALLASPLLTSLSRLELTDAHVLEAPAIELAGVLRGSCPRLETLVLSNAPGYLSVRSAPTNLLGDVTVSTVASAVRALRHLDVNLIPELTDRLLQHLQPLGGQLEWLGLRGTKVTSHAARHLRAFTALRALDLTATRIDDAIVPALLAMPALETLAIEQTRISRAARHRLQHKLRLVAQPW